MARAAAQRTIDAPPRTSPRVGRARVRAVETGPTEPTPKSRPSSAAAPRPSTPSLSRWRQADHPAPRAAATPGPRSAASSRRIFTAFCSFGVAVAVVAAATIWVRTQCAQNAYALSRLKTDLVTERQRSEALRVRMLAMGAPGRIENIAARRLAMVEPDQITFLRRQMPAHEAAPRREAPRRRPGALENAGRWLSRSAQDFTILSLGELGLPAAGR